MTKEFLKTAIRYVSETWRGKDLNRTLGNFSLREIELRGKVLDVGGGSGRASYRRFLKVPAGAAFTNLDGKPEAQPDILADIDAGGIPLPDSSFDAALAFNLLEHLADPSTALLEIRRVCRRGGLLVGLVPFLVNVHPDPNDYARFTSQGLSQMLSAAGFSAVEIVPVGAGPFSAGYYQVEFLLPRVARLACGPLALSADWLLGKCLRRDWAARFPLCFRFTATAG